MTGPRFASFTAPSSYWQASRAPRYSLLFALPLLARPLGLGWWTRLMVSLGAGIYEELLFRVLLVTGLAAAARTLLGWSPVAAGSAATLLGAAIFSAFHYIGPYGDRWQLYSFL